MAIQNEATIRVKIDGRDAEISVKDLGKAIDVSMKKARESAKKAQSAFDKIGDSAQKLWFTFQNVKAIVNRTEEMSQLAAKAVDVRKAFNEVAPPNFLKELRANVKGTVGDFDLMQKSIVALDLGATTEQLKTFTKFARFEGLRKGVSTVRVFGDIVSGVLRGSTELLDNFGLTTLAVSQKINELSGGKALTALERRALSVTASVELMNERLAKFGDQAVSNTERLKQFTVALDNLKVLGGELKNTVLLPLSQLLMPIVRMITGMPKTLKQLAVVIGLVSAAIFKLNPALLTLIARLKVAKISVTSLKTSFIALKVAAKGAWLAIGGPIGAVIIAIETLATAWFLNLGNMQENAKLFLTFITTWAGSLKDLFRGIGNMFFGLLSHDMSMFFDGLFDLIGGASDKFWKEFNLIYPPEAKDSGDKTGKAFGDAMGEAAAETFTITFADELFNRMTDLKKKFTGDESLFEDFKQFLADLEAIKTPFQEFKDNLRDTGSIATETFSIMENGIDSFSRELSERMIGMKNQFKDIGKITIRNFKGVWIQMLRDFTTLFWKEVIKRLALLAIMKLNPATGGLPGVGQLPIGGGGSISNAGIGQLNTTNSLLSNISTQLAQRPQIMISSERLYRAVVHEQQRENVRQGNPLNGLVFGT